VFIVLVIVDKSINLSFVTIIVQGKSLAVLEVKEIYNKWKLCYYCKLQHSSKIAKKCLNKKSFILRLVDLNDIASVDEDVSQLARKV